MICYLYHILKLYDLTSHGYVVIALGADLDNKKIF